MSGITGERIKALVGRPDPIILEIGANDGEHTRMFLELFEDAKVFCFEPDARAQRRFLGNLIARPALHGWQLFRCAVGDKDGTIDFFPSYADGVVQPIKEWDCSGSIRKPKTHLRRYPWCMFRPAVSVDIVRLDTWAQSWLDGEATIDFLWADVQGAEGDLIAGGRETLRRTRYFYTEYSNEEMYEGQARLDHILAALPEFELLTQYPNDVLLRNRQWT